MATAPKASAAQKVTVACKLPHGLRLRIFRMVDGTENISGNNVRMVKTAEQVGEDVVIKGVAVEFGREKALASGFALTPNVDKEFFDEWLKQNAQHDAVKNGLIFAATTRDAVEGKAEDNKSIRSGLEPLDMSMVKRGENMVAADPRLPRVSNPNLSAIAQDTDNKSAA